MDDSGIEIINSIALSSWIFCKADAEQQIIRTRITIYIFPNHLINNPSIKN